VVPDDSGWWLAIATPHTNMPLALASSLGIALMVLGVFLLLSGKAARWLRPLAAMGSMTLTLYSLHLVALALDLHSDEPGLWFVVHAGVAAVFAWFWLRSFRRGPLELIVTRGVNGVRSAVNGGDAAGPGQGSEFTVRMPRR
jgi:uncharacterized membrane protein YeiB